jgi:glutamate 5-kinase
MIYNRIVIKLGTSTLTAGTNSLSMPQIIELIRQMSLLHDNGVQIILVTSAAMAAGRQELNYPELPKHLPAKQMLAAIGQPRLMEMYSQLFRIYGKIVAQILVTRDDMSDRRRYINARNTIEAILNQGVIPIINENDTVATEEIRVGDNDNLSALIVNLIESDLLLILTDQKGLYSKDPRKDSDAILIKEIKDHDIPSALWDMAGGSGTKLGTGGMNTKLEAADLARRSGAAVIIARGKDPNVILRSVNGENTGTFFHPVTSKLESRKRYMLAGMRDSSRLIIDNGAKIALLSGGSLLPIGIIELKGKFDRGDTVQISMADGEVISLGLVNYSILDLRKLIGHHTDEIEAILGYTFGEEVVHHNDMVVL